MKKISLHIILLSSIVCLFGCKKYLDKIPDPTQTTPVSVVDAQALMDNTSATNNFAGFPLGLGIVSSDEYYLSPAQYNSFASISTSVLAYNWQENLTTINKQSTPWNNTYSSIFSCNVALEALSKIKPTPGQFQAYNNAKGDALFFRGNMFFNLAIVYGKAYDQATAAGNMGIPLVMTTDFTAKATRSSLQATYDQTLSDLHTSLTLLPTLPTAITRPSKAGAYGLLARVYLNMRNYQKAGSYADSALRLIPDLIDYNTINAASTYPFSDYNHNNEVITQLITFVSSPLTLSKCSVNPIFYDLYQTTDLRKTVYFSANNEGGHYFKGTYGYSNTNLFSGPATDEMYLIRAECYARADKVNEAMTDLNTLLIKRYKTGTFISLTAHNSQDALQLVLTERKKELVFRGLRWMDLKRLNAEGANITQTRTVNGQVFTLAPNANAYALQIPLNVLSLSGMPPNPR